MGHWGGWSRCRYMQCWWRLSSIATKFWPLNPAFLLHCRTDRIRFLDKTSKQSSPKSDMSSSKVVTLAKNDYCNPEEDPASHNPNPSRRLKLASCTGHTSHYSPLHSRWRTCSRMSQCESTSQPDATIYKRGSWIRWYARGVVSWWSHSCLTGTHWNASGRMSDTTANTALLCEFCPRTSNSRSSTQLC